MEIVNHIKSYQYEDRKQECAIKKNCYMYNKWNKTSFFIVFHGMWMTKTKNCFNIPVSPPLWHRTLLLRLHISQRNEMFRGRLVLYSTLRQFADSVSSVTRSKTGTKIQKTVFYMDIVNVWKHNRHVDWFFSELNIDLITTPAFSCDN